MSHPLQAVGPPMFDGPADLRPLVGSSLPAGPWQAVDAESLALFRAATSTQAAPTEAERFFLLALLGPMVRSALGFRAVRLGINYGLNHVRFLRNPPPGAAIRHCFTVRAVNDIPPSGALAGTEVVLGVRLECRDGGGPLLQAETVGRYYVATTP